MNICYFSRKKARSVFSIPSARIPYIDVTIVLSGVLRYTFNGEKLELHSGDAIVFQMGDTREREEGGAAEYYSFNVEAGESFDMPVFSGKLSNCVNEEIITLLKLYSGCFDDTSLYASEKGNCCFRMIYYTLFERYNEMKQDSHASRIKQCIAEHLNEPITLSQISAEVFLSPNYCNYIFKSHTGMTITDYVLLVKMERAKKLLTSTGMSLPEIAYSLGYKQYSYFSRLFAKKVGQSPASFRKDYLYAKEDEL